MRRNRRSAEFAGVRRNAQDTARTSSSDTNKPSIGARKIPKVVLITPDQTTAATPALLIPAPSRPPNSAWLLDEGKPSAQETMFQTLAPLRAAKITAAS